MCRGSDYFYHDPLTADWNNCIPGSTKLIRDIIVANSKYLSSAELLTDIHSWRLISDRVMGGVSSGQLAPDHYRDRDCLRMRGSVSTENNGGFIQMSHDLSRADRFLPSDHEGICLIVAGNSQQYNIHLRSSEAVYPWESYRAGFTAADEWQEIHILFEQFKPHRTVVPLDLKKLARIGLVAIGRDFEADLRVNSLRFIGRPLDN